jgi:hypothetical protein
MQRGQGAFRAGEEALVQALADQVLDGLRQAPLTATAVGAAGGQIRRHAEALPVTPNQAVDPPAGQPEPDGGLVGLRPPDHGQRGQGRDGLRPQNGLRPSRLRQRQQPPLRQGRRLRIHAPRTLVKRSSKHSRVW